MNVFSSEAYLFAVADAFFPGRPRRIEARQVAGNSYEMLVLERQGWKLEKAVPWLPFMDFLEPTGAASTKPGPHLPAVSHGRVSAQAWLAMPNKLGLQCSPTIDFSLFPTWDAFVAFSKAQSPAGFMGNRLRQAKKLSELRGMEIRWNDDTPEALKLVLDWKSEQYRGAGYVDAFASTELVKSFELLRERGKLLVATLRLDGKIVAGHAGLEHEGRFYYWLPAYDKAFAKDSVGAILLEWMIEHSYKLGHQEFDFLLGSEKYKWAYATHSRLVGALGAEALAVRAWRPVRAGVMKQVRKHSHMYARLQELKRRMLYARMSVNGY